MRVLATIPLGIIVLGFLLLLVNSQAPSNEEEVTFLVFDNGASDGSVEVTFSYVDFSTIIAGETQSLTEGEQYTINELLAIELSRKYINVSKFGQEPGTVVATKAFREDGETITTFDQLRPEWGAIRRVYLVPDGLQFVWPFVEIGHKQKISISVIAPVSPDFLPIVLESLSETPRVFKVHHLFSATESEKLIDNALNLTGDQALAVGNKEDEAKGKEVHDRTSHNAWDSTSPTAKSVISRSFDLTRIVEDVGQIDGLQVVRYTPGQGYNTHPDFFETGDVAEDFNFLPYSGGSNRFATVFMYLSNVEEGGSTVFPYTPPLAEPKPIPESSLEMLKENTWEYNLNKECHSKLSVEPRIGTAALFYSVRPDGQLDHKSYHGACPVIKGLKWGANIWIWNKQRYGATKSGGEPRILTVLNEHLQETVYLTWEGHPQGELRPGQSVGMNTFEFHRFQAHLGSHENKEILDEFTVQSKPEHQVWSIQPPRNLSPKSEAAAEEEKKESDDNDYGTASEEEEQKNNIDDSSADIEDNNTNNNTSNHSQQRILIITNPEIQERLYITWEGIQGTVLSPGEGVKVNTFQSHLFEAKIGSFESELVVSRYIVGDSIDEQLWTILPPPGTQLRQRQLEEEQEEL